MAQRKTLKSRPLTGKALLDRVKKLEDLSGEDKARECGYSKITEDGSERLYMIRFMNALLEAEGIDVDVQSEAPSKSKKGGRTINYRVSVQSNGNLLIGAAYTKMMNLQPGDEFTVSLGRKHIHLTQVLAEELED